MGKAANHAERSQLSPHLTCPGRGLCLHLVLSRTTATTTSSMMTQVAAASTRVSISLSIYQGLYLKHLCNTRKAEEI